MGESSRGLFRGFLFSRKGNKSQVTVRGFGGCQAEAPMVGRRADGQPVRQTFTEWYIQSSLPLGWVQCFVWDRYIRELVSFLTSHGPDDGKKSSPVCCHLGLTSSYPSKASSQRVCTITAKTYSPGLTVRNYESFLSRCPWGLDRVSCLDRRAACKVVSMVDGFRREQRPVLARGPDHMSRRQQQTPAPKRWRTLEVGQENSDNLNTGNGSQSSPGEIVWSPGSTQQVLMYVWANYSD